MPPRSRIVAKFVEEPGVEDEPSLKTKASLKRTQPSAAVEDLVVGGSPRGGRRKHDSGMHDTMKGRVQAAGTGQDGEGDGGPYEAVVKVFATHCEPNYR